MQLKKSLPALLLTLLLATAASAQSPGVASAPDPNLMIPGFGEPGSSINASGGFYNPNGRTLRSSVLPNSSTVLVLIYAGQSLAASSSSGAVPTITNSAHIFNFNIYDGGVYACQHPVLGSSLAGFAGTVANPGTSPVCNIADTLITNSVFSDVIVVPIAIGGTSVADWQSGGAIFNRIAVTCNRLVAAHLTPASGFLGTLYIAWHQGETDNQNGTTRANMAAGVRNIAGAFSTACTGTSRFFVATESMLNGAVSANITNGQADAVSSGCTTCRAGPNWDTSIPNSGGNRQGDGTHLAGPALGLALAISTDVTVLTNCKNTSC